MKVLEIITSIFMIIGIIVAYIFAMLSADGDTVFIVVISFSFSVLILGFIHILIDIIKE